MGLILNWPATLEVNLEFQKSCSVDEKNNALDIVVIAFYLV